MKRKGRVLLAGLMLALPFSLGACTFDLGNGCTLLLFEPGTQFGVSCNLL